MKWQAHKVSWQLKSGLHVGTGGYGYIRQTRLYVPGRTLLGAMMARLLARFRGVYSDPEALLQQARHLFRWGYGFPAVGGRLLRPRWEDGELFYSHGEEARYSAAAVEQALLVSQASTSLDEKRTALDASLHEIEYISPYLRVPLTYTDAPEQVGGANSSARPSGSWTVGTPVCLQAWVAVHQEVESDPILRHWQAVLAEMVVGGERRYGFGRLKLLSVDQGTTAPWADSSGDWPDDGPLLTLPPEAPLPGHARVATQEEGGRGDEPDQVAGQLEVLVWRSTTRRNQYGGTLDTGGPAWAPGTRFKEHEGPRRYRLGADSLYHLMPGP